MMVKKSILSTLVILNFIIYISLGLPDSILGSAWPSMRENYGMGASQISYLTSIILLFSVLSSFLYTKIASYFTTSQVIFTSMILVIIGLILMMVTSNPWVLFISTPFMGIGQGAIDVTVNHFAAKHLPSSLMSLLHGFYGLGVSISSAILTFFLGNFASWRLAILMIAILEILILGLIFIYRQQFSEISANLPDSVDNASQEGSQKFKLAYFINPLFYFFYAIEGVVGIFIATYYVEYFQVSSAEAAFFTTLFWLGLMFGRFLTGALTRFFSDKVILFGHLLGLFVMSLMLLLPPGVYTVLTTFMLGLTMSALYPMMMMVPNRIYSDPIAKQVISYNVGFCMLGTLIFPLIFSSLFKGLGFGIFPYLICGLTLALFMIAGYIFKKYQTI